MNEVSSLLEGTFLVGNFYASSEGVTMNFLFRHVKWMEES